MRKVDDVVAFVDDTGRAVYGRVLAVTGEVLVVLDTTGCFYRVVSHRALGTGQSTPDGEMLIPSSEVAFQVAEETRDMLADPLVGMVAKRLVRLPIDRLGLFGRSDLAPASHRASRPYYEAFDAVPMAMFTGRQLDDAGRPQMTISMERYIFSSDERRNREARLLRRMKDRAPRQWLVYVEVKYRGLTQADVCRKHGLSSGNTSVQYRKADDWMAARMGTNVMGV